MRSLFAGLIFAKNGSPKIKMPSERQYQQQQQQQEQQQQDAFREAKDVIMYNQGA